MKHQLRNHSIVPFLTICGAIKSQEDNLKNKKGIFAPEEERTETDKLKRKWYNDSIRRSVSLMNDMDIMFAFQNEFVKKDPPTACIIPPFCCSWWTPGPRFVSWNEEWKTLKKRRGTHFEDDHKGPWTNHNF